jgi:hypothetical protein
LEALPPHHGCYSTRYEVGVVPHTVANEVNESQLPGLETEYQLQLKTLIFTILENVYFLTLLGTFSNMAYTKESISSKIGYRTYSAESI